MQPRAPVTKEGVATLLLVPVVTRFRTSQVEVEFAGRRGRREEPSAATSPSGFIARAPRRLAPTAMRSEQGPRPGRHLPTTKAGIMADVPSNRSERTVLTYVKV